MSDIAELFRHSRAIHNDEWDDFVYGIYKYKYYSLKLNTTRQGQYLLKYNKPFLLSDDSTFLHLVFNIDHWPLSGL